MSEILRCKGCGRGCEGSMVTFLLINNLSHPCPLDIPSHLQPNEPRCPICGKPLHLVEDRQCWECDDSVEDHLYSGPDYDPDGRKTRAQTAKFRRESLVKAVEVILAGGEPDLNALETALKDG